MQIYNLLIDFVVILKYDLNNGFVKLKAQLIIDLNHFNAKC